MDQRDIYEIKYNLLRKKFQNIQNKNEKLQNRIYHIRKQIQYMRCLKRIIIQKLLVYGDRFMDVCLEIPDMEPGANVADQVIDVVAELPKPATPPAVVVKKKRHDSNVHRRPSHPKIPATPRSDTTTNVSKSLNLEEIVNSVIHESTHPSESIIITHENQLDNNSTASVPVETPHVFLME